MFLTLSLFIICCFLIERDLSLMRREISKFVDNYKNTYDAFTSARVKVNKLGEAKTKKLRLFFIAEIFKKYDRIMREARNKSV
jgi:hypothetical protein